jgi:hypothetical protein
MSRGWRCLLLAMLLAQGVLAHAAGPAAFSRSGLQGWTAQTFADKTATRYQLRDGYLQAECRASASGLAWRQSLRLADTPILSWRWRVHDLLEGIDERRKGGDDFLARVYVVVDGGWAVWRTRSLVYVWSNGETPATDWPSAYTGQAHIIALRAGAAGLGEWQREQRDLAADFQRYFGMVPERIHALALMSDCDDSGGAGRADYGDIQLGPAP